MAKEVPQAPKYQCEHCGKIYGYISIDISFIIYYNVKSWKVYFYDN